MTGGHCCPADRGPLPITGSTNAASDVGSVLWAINGWLGVLVLTSLVIVQPGHTDSPRRSLNALRSLRWAADELRSLNAQATAAVCDRAPASALQDCSRWWLLWVGAGVKAVLSPGGRPSERQSGRLRRRSVAPPFVQPSPGGSRPIIRSEATSFAEIRGRHRNQTIEFPAEATEEEDRRSGRLNPGRQAPRVEADREARCCAVHDHSSDKPSQLLCS